MNNFGLSDDVLNNIKSIFLKSDKVKKVVLYGSRAKGTYKNGSDIDLTVLGDDLDLNTLYSFEDDIDELMLPYKVDLSLYADIDNPKLIEHIDRVGINIL